MTAGLSLEALRAIQRRDEGASLRTKSCGRHVKPSSVRGALLDARTGNRQPGSDVTARPVSSSLPGKQKSSVATTKTTRD